MAHSKSAQKRIRQTEVRTELNKARRSRIRTFIKKIDEAVAGGDATAARAALRDAQAEIDRGVVKGVIKRNTASRTVSRLNARVKAVAAPST